MIELYFHVLAPDGSNLRHEKHFHKQVSIWIDISCVLFAYYDFFHFYIERKLMALICLKSNMIEECKRLFWDAHKFDLSTFESSAKSGGFLNFHQAVEFDDRRNVTVQFRQTVALITFFYLVYHLFLFWFWF